VRAYCIDLNALRFFLQKRLCVGASKEELSSKISWQCREETALPKVPGGCSLSLDKIDRKLLRAFLAQQQLGGLSRRSIVRSLSSLRTFFKFCKAMDLLEKDPSEGLATPKIEKKVPQSLSYDQVVKLFEQPDFCELLGLRDRAILELFYSSGLRVSELVGMNRSDFDSEQMLLKVRGKGKKERLIPITQSAARWIVTYLACPQRYLDGEGHSAEVDSEAVFLNRFGKRLTGRSVDRLFDKYLKISGLAGKPTPHTIRHTIATHWLENGMDLKIIQELLGHSSLAATTIYTKVSMALKKRVYDAAHPRA